MARNAEKAQSMLYRFRESKASELGLITNMTKRPKAAIACSNLREAERWRGDIMREISRKVSKIQDFGLTDYEVRDLNDQINDLMRQKANWENQIISLGGANYKRAAPKVLDADGREVPGARGYKYFGRAKDLPGVKELFSSQAADLAELESFKTHKYEAFSNVGPDYYGDLDDPDGKIAEFEKEAEEEEWEEACAHLAEQLGIPEDSELLPKMPKPSWVSLQPTEGEDDTQEAEEAEEPATKKGKRKAAPKKAAGKKARTDDAQDTSGKVWTVLDVRDLRHPKPTTVEDLEKIIVEREKKALLEDYLG